MWVSISLGGAANCGVFHSHLLGSARRNATPRNKRHFDDVACSEHRHGARPGIYLVTCNGSANSPLARNGSKPTLLATSKKTQRIHDTKSCVVHIIQVCFHPSTTIIYDKVFDLTAGVYLIFYNIHPAPSVSVPTPPINRDELYMVTNHKTDCNTCGAMPNATNVGAEHKQYITPDYVRGRNKLIGWKKKRVKNEKNGKKKKERNEGGKRCPERPKLE